MPSSTSTFSGVAIATWAVATPGTPWTVRLTCSSRTESAYAPGSGGDVGVHAAVVPSWPRRWSASRAPASRPRPEEWPTLVRAARAGGWRRCPARRRTPRTRGSPRRAARSRAASPRASWCGRGRARTSASTASVATPAARCTASQPQSTSSPNGVRPSPRPSRELTRSGRRGSEVAGRAEQVRRDPRDRGVDDPADRGPGGRRGAAPRRGPRRPQWPTGPDRWRRSAARRAPRWRWTRARPGSGRRGRGRARAGRGGRPGAARRRGRRAGHGPGPVPRRARRTGQRRSRFPTLVGSATVCRCEVVPTIPRNEEPRVDNG